MDKKSKYIRRLNRPESSRSNRPSKRKHFLLRLKQRLGLDMSKEDYEALCSCLYGSIPSDQVKIGIGIKLTSNRRLVEIEYMGLSFVGIADSNYKAFVTCLTKEEISIETFFPRYIRNNPELIAKALSKYKEIEDRIREEFKSVGIERAGRYYFVDNYSDIANLLVAREKGKYMPMMIVSHIMKGNLL